MRNTTFNRVPVNQPGLGNYENQDWAAFQTAILFAAGGGLPFGLLGFFLLIVFTVFERNNRALNYAGVGSLIFAFIFFGLTAHFMDKSDENKRRHKKPESKNLTGNGFSEKNLEETGAGN